MSKRDRRFLDIAAKAAENSEVRFRHGAVITKNGNVLSIGINRYVEHRPESLSPEHLKRGMSRHAEIIALQRVANPKGCTIYVARLMADGSEGNSKPCAACQDTLAKAGVRKVVYTQ